MASVSFAGVAKTYPDGTRAVHPFDLEVNDSDLMVLIGPSGCGKTTLLRMAAGLEEITDGELLIDGLVVNDVEPRKRDVAMVFQNYALYPHMSVFDNLAFPLVGRLPKNEIKARVISAATMLGLDELLKRRPRTLSGGQRQRVAMGRALVREPKVFLMDEPLSNLDAKLRVQMRAEIRKLQREVGITTIYVTHDQIEAMTMGSRIAVMRKGVLQQQGPPQELYDAPTTLFVATFLGSPGMNLLRGKVERADGALRCVIGDAYIELSPEAMAAHPLLSAYDGRTVAVGIRPEHLAQLTTSEQQPNVIRGRVQMVEALGAQNIIHAEVPAEPVITDEIMEVAKDVDPSALDLIESESKHHHVVVTAVLDGDVRVEEDTPIGFATDPRRMHFFDLETGTAIC